MNQVPTGKEAPKKINVIVEIPQGSHVKYEVDKETGAIFADRFLHTSMYFPFNYGYVPQTLAEDKDPLDILVLSDTSVAPGTVIPSQPIGMLEMEDEEGIDTKLVAVPTKKIDPLYGEYTDVSQIPDAIKNKIKHFFENYKSLEPGKWVKIKEWKGKEEAEQEIEKGIKAFK